MKKKLPYGLSNYETLIDDNYVYVDKTKYIEIMENLHDRFMFFLRPRRFGKSLFTSVLENYYDVNKKDDFEKLFGDKYIGKNPTRERNAYRVVKFNFSSLNTDTREKLESEFTTKVKEGLDKFMYQYGYDFEYLKDASPSIIFGSFLNKYYQFGKVPLYIIIDEYDHFANELLSFKLDMFSEIISKTGFVRKFYEALKVGTETIVKRIFATGVSPITLDSLTSGFNIASDFTRDPRFNEMMGFTEDEVRALILTADDTLSENKVDDIIYEMRKNYNGYLFSVRAKKTVFNSDMVLYYLKHFEDFGIEPEELIDKNIASDYAKLGNMFSLKNKDRNMKVLQKILNGEEVNAAITAQFSLEKDFDDDDFMSLLFYLGLLTIDREDLGDVVLKVPNNVIKELYFDYFGKKMKEEIEYELETSDIRKAIKTIAQKGDNSELIDIVERTLRKLSKRDYIQFNEKYVKLIFLTYCFLSKLYLVKSEYEVLEGYIDIALLKQINVVPTYFAIIEFKYIKVSDFEKQGQNLVDEKLAQAKKQLLQYETSRELKEIKKLKKWAIIFVGEKCVANEEI